MIQQPVIPSELLMGFMILSLMTYASLFLLKRKAHTSYFKLTTLNHEVFISFWFIALCSIIPFFMNVKEKYHEVLDFAYIGVLLLWIPILVELFWYIDKKLTKNKV
jgi:hypothetical protein